MKARKYLVIILSILFIFLTLLIKMDLVSEFDNFIYNLFTINDTNTLIFKSITFLGSTLFVILLCIFFFILFKILKKKQGYILVGVVIISTIFNNIIKLLIRRERPLVLKLVIEKTFSFPSGHTMASVSLYGILIYLVLKSNLNKKLKVILSIMLGIIPLLVGISRIYLGAHFATDIIGGYLLASILLIIETYYIDKYSLLV